ncbi:hypothetical protein B0A52_10024 [Exophiala mesophila]|uniref:HAUS augmin-like complex subunit 4 n=1 Tax=Exophiala mesophila TaxID=212818 RepID=A0A438MR41_EXOME|nr:hypothetical protein B0A52_10024 [Exophiala mesophila]
MVPPVSPQTLEQNPQFAKLWKHLTTEILDVDASQKSLNEKRRWLPRLASDNVVSGGDAVSHLNRPKPDDNQEEDGEDQDEEEEDDDDEEEHEASQDWNGPTENKRKKEQRKDIDQQIEDLRIRQARREILSFSLSQAAYSTDGPSREEEGPSREEHHTYDTSRTDSAELSPEIKDILLLVSTSLEQDDESLLPQEDRDRFMANLDTISSAVGRYLITTEKRLTELASLATAVGNGDGNGNGTGSDKLSTTTTGLPTINSPQTPSKLSTHLTLQLQHLNHLHTTSLPTSLTTLHEVNLKLQTSQLLALQTLLTQLEKSKHGMETRHSLARAAFFAAVAQTMDLKVQVMLLEARERSVAEGARMNEWAGARLRELRMEKVEELKRVCDEYEAVDPGGKIMRALGTRYRDVEEEISAVKEDIERLERGEVNMDRVMKCDEMG